MQPDVKKRRKGYFRLMNDMGADMMHIVDDRTLRRKKQWSNYVCIALIRKKRFHFDEQYKFPYLIDI